MLSGILRLFLKLIQQWKYAEVGMRLRVIDIHEIHSVMFTGKVETYVTIVAAKKEAGDKIRQTP